MKNIFWAIFLMGSQLMAQEVTPYFENFTKLEYQGENSNWDLAQHPNGTLYVANGRNLLVFNGDFWRKYQLPEPRIIRSVEVINDTIYTGAYHQFGYWVYNAKNQLKYTSLSENIDKKYFDNDEIWKIHSYGDQIIFQSFSKLFVYHKSTKKLEVIPFGNISAIFSFLIDDELFLTTRNHGIYKLIDGKFQMLKWSVPLKNYSIQGIAPYKNGILIATQMDGLYYYDGANLSPWATSLEKGFENLEINNIQTINNRVYLGTINNGLLALDTLGNLVFEFNKKNGMPNNTVLRQMVGIQHNLWLGLDNGLSKIYLREGLRWFNDKSGNLGTVYTLLPNREAMVLGSNHGVFYLTENGLEFLVGSNGQVWDLTQVGDEIIVGHNNGTFGIKNKDFYLINDINGGMGFKNIPETSIFIQPNYTGIAHYRKNNGTWTYKRYGAIHFPVKSVFFDERGDLWVEATHRGVYKYEFKNEFSKLNLVKHYERLSVRANLFQLGKTIFIQNADNIFKYDPINDTLIKAPLLVQKITPFKGISSVKNGFLVVDNQRSLKLVDLASNHQLILNEELTVSRVLQGFPNAMGVGDSIFVFLDNGFLLARSSALFKPQDSTRVAMQQVRVKEKDVPLNKAIEIPYAKNSIQFLYSSSAPGLLAAPRYSYILKGYDERWSKPTFSSGITYSNLPAGEYIFEVKTINQPHEKEPASFRFEVLKPWYYSDIAMIIYLLLLLGALYLVHLYNKRKYTRRQRIFTNKMEYEKRLAIQKHNFENDQKITRLEQEKLKGKLKGKSKELASYAALLAQKEDILKEMESVINKSQIKKQNNKLYSKLMDIKHRQTNNENEWKLFQRNFNEVHDEFFKTLQNKYPALTPKDLQLCAYLKLNLSSKEIAPLIGITFRSVELHRYRLRKKLHLSKSQNLVKFLIKIN